MTIDEVTLFSPDNFEPSNHFYPKALNSQLHAMVSHFLNLDHDRLIKRYIHLNPQVDAAALKDILSYQSNLPFNNLHLILTILSIF